MSEAVRDGWGLAVASLLGGEEARLRGDVLDAGGGAAPFARTLPEARLHEISSPHGHDAFLKEPGQLRPAFDCVYGEC